MTFTLLYLAIGALFIVMALSGSLLARLPLSASLVYLIVGIVIGPSGVGLLDFDIVVDAAMIERLTEVAVIVSLFSAGLKLRVDWRDPIWRLPVRLASISMLVTVGIIAAAGTLLLSLPLGAAILLGAILAPTDPVLASDVQVAHPRDQDRVRFGLTGEAGLNDGTAFPFVMLGLGLLGHHGLGEAGWRWIGIDLAWATIGGLAIGALAGTAIGHLVLALRRSSGHATGLDDFLSLGLIALAYGAALLAHTYGFLAVFAAGCALRRIEHRSTGDDLRAIEQAVAAAGDDAATTPRTAPAFMASAVLGFNEKLERIAEVAVVVVVGSLLSGSLRGSALWFVPMLVLLVRPLAVAAGTLNQSLAPTQRLLIAWFGIRGIGSVYYLTYAIAHGLEEPYAGTLADLTLVTIASSVVIHGISVTPVMNRYESRIARKTTLPEARVSGA